MTNRCLASIRSTTLAITVAAASAVVLSAPTAQADAAPRTCKHHGDHVLVHGATLELLEHSSGQEGQADLHDVFACRVASKHRQRLGPRAATGTAVQLGVRTLTVAGEYVAYERDTQDNAEGLSELVIQRITATSSRTRIAVSAEFNDGPNPGTFRDIAVADDGSTAFISTVNSTVPLAVYRCQSWGCPTAPPEVIDRGANLDPHSLKRVGSQVQWVRDGTRHSAPLSTATSR